MPPYDSEAQKRLFEAVRHGWTPDHIKGPTKTVAEKFHREDAKGSRKRKMMAAALRQKGRDEA